ncbi:Predicted dehydrogenase [Bacillus sp. cl95]|nr:Predicted dehydrogenase [Bacillus sp. UNCCL13]SFQ89911.1 Predicted dehydrogenase [Bacillus sp. cl95]
MTVLNIGVIGVGGVGEKVMKAFIEHPETIVKGVYDVSKERALEIAEKYDVVNFEKCEELFKQEDIDLIYIAVPPKYHHRFVMEAIQHDKHVFCEKPLASNLEEAQEMQREAEQRGLLTSINFPTIHKQEFKMIEKLLHENFIGDLRRVEVHCHFQDWPRPWQKNAWISSREQGGFTREVLPHYIQMIQMLFGDIKIVHKTVEYALDSSKCETGMIAFGEVNEGVHILLHGSVNLGMSEKLQFTIYGTEGSMSLVDWSQLWISRKGQRPEKMELPAENHIHAFIDQLVKSFKGEEARIVSFKDGCAVQAVLDDLLIQEDY